MPGFTWLLRLLPASFRAEYATDMERAIEARWADCLARGGRFRALRFWWREALAVALLAVRLRLKKGEGSMLRDLWHDLRFGLRGLLRRPGFTIIAVGTLALGIGSSTAIFSAVHAVLLRDLPYEDADRLVTLFHSDLDTGDRTEGISAANVEDLRESSSRLSTVAVAEPWGLDLELGDRAENLRAWTVSEGFFDALGAQPELGRLFDDQDYVDGNQFVAVLGHASWIERFGGDPEIIGRTLLMEGDTYSVVGVLPPAFKYPDEREIWIPRPDKPWDAGGRAAGFMAGIARLDDGVSVAEAQADVSAVAASLAEQYPDTNTDTDLVIVPLREHLFGDVRTPLLVLLGAVAFVLIIACANVAGLLLARGRQREREYALRSALGASSGRILRQVTSESLLLATAGCVLGIVMAIAGVRIIQSLGPVHLPRFEELRIDVTVLGFAVLVSGLSAVLAGLAPSLRLMRPDLRGAMNNGGRGSTEGPRGMRLRGRLVVAEVALSVVLLIGAGLLLKSFNQILDKELGFEPENRLALQVFAYGYQGTGLVDFVNGAVDNMLAIPGVTDVALTTAVPGSTDDAIAGIDVDVPYHIADRDPPPRGQEPQASVIQVTSSIFDVLDIPVVAGRGFELSDNSTAIPVIIVNEALAMRDLGRVDAVGERISIQFGDTVPTVREIIGVVQDVRPLGYESEARPEAYIPLTQVGAGSLTFVVETQSDPAAFAAPAREAIWASNPAQAIWGTATLESLLNDRLRERRFNLYLISAFAIIAMLLAAVGVYGLISFSVEQRLGEFGIRRTLGGTAPDILGMVVREGAILSGIGVVLGVIGAVFLTRFMEGMLLEVEPTDPATFAMLATGVMGVSLLASVVPGVRAMHVDPAEALRED